MSVYLATEAEGFFSTDPAAACHVVVLSENPVARARAESLSDRLAAQFRDELPFESECWNFSDIWGTTSTRQMVESLNRADILIVSLQAGELPPVIAAWLESWAECRTKPEGALVLMSAEPAEASGATAILSGIARKLGMDFLSMVPPIDAARTVPAQTYTATSEFGETAAPLYSRDWGLNE